MATTLSDVPQGVAPIWEVLNRIEYHLQPGCLLEGATLWREKELGAAGESDLPLIQPRHFTQTEEIFAGAKDVGATPGSTPIRPVIVFAFYVTTYKENGWLQYDPTGDLSTNLDAMGAVELCHRLMDAIERKAQADQQRDSLLNRYLSEPISFAIIEGDDVSELGWTVKLDITLKLHPMCRGERSSLKP